MISSVCFLVLGCLAVPAQSAEQALESYRKGSELLGRGSLEEALRLAEAAALARPDHEGLLRVRVGAGLEDREFEPRRLAGDACLALARKAALPEERAKLLAAAVAWYQASLDRGLKKASPLIDAARSEGARDVVDAAKRELSAILARGHYETAYEALDRRRSLLPADAAAALRAETDAAFRRWQDGLLAELREDLKRLALDARWERYRVPAERASKTRRDPALDWAAGLSGVKDVQDLDPALDASVALGMPYFQPLQEFALARHLEAIRDPGSSRSLDERWEAVMRRERDYSDARVKAQKRALQLPEGKAWIETALSGDVQKLATIRKTLPDRGAVQSVAEALQRLVDPSFNSGARAEAYTALEADLERLLDQAPTERGRIRAGQLLARTQALYLSGVSREDVLGRSADLLREADPGLLDVWAPELSPRLKWILEQGRKR